MSGIYLPRLFPPHIVERGLLYFQQGNVRKASARRYQAEMFGSEDYSAWLKPDNVAYSRRRLHPRIVGRIGTVGVLGY